MKSTIVDKIKNCKDNIADTKGKIEKAETEMRQLENHITRLVNQNKIAERKARTHRLIERGAIVESLIDGAVEMSNEQVKYTLERALASLNYSGGRD